MQKTIESYFLGTVEATSTLFEKKLFGHLLVVIYSTIDTMGLLDAPTSQESATRETFKQWVKKYLLSYPGLEFNEVDLYAARCAVLHTHTSKSALSSSGQARELQYYSGDRESATALRFVSLTKSIQNGIHLPVRLDDLLLALFDALKKFAIELDTKCNSDSACSKRLGGILQLHNMQDVL